jgi:hypothetical protein
MQERKRFEKQYIFYRLRHLGCSDSVIWLHLCEGTNYCSWAAIRTENGTNYCKFFKRTAKTVLAPETEDKKSNFSL